MERILPNSHDGGEGKKKEGAFGGTGWKNAPVHPSVHPGPIGEKHETSSAELDSIHTRYPTCRPPLCVLTKKKKTQNKQQKKKEMLKKITGAASGGHNASAQKTHSCASSAVCQNVRGWRGRGGGGDGEEKGGGG